MSKIKYSIGKLLIVCSRKKKAKPIYFNDYRKNKNTGDIYTFPTCFNNNVAGSCVFILLVVIHQKPNSIL